VKKSSARIPCARDRSNSAQPGPSRRGAGSIPALLKIRQTADGATLMPSPASSPWIRRQPRTRSPPPAAAPPTAHYGTPADGRHDATRAPAGGARCRDASARSCREPRSAASPPAARQAASRPAAPATPGPATSNANEQQAADAGRQRADGAASRSPRPSTTTPGATSPAPTPHGTRSGRSASSPQAVDHSTPGPAKTLQPNTDHRTEPACATPGIRPGGIGFRHPQCPGCRLSRRKAE
jgi:hypothetical protein